MDRNGILSRQINLAMEKFETPNDLKDIHLIEFILAKCIQIPDRLKKFNEEIERAKGKEVKVSMLTLVDDDTTLAQMKEEFFKQIYNIQHLHLHFFGNFTDDEKGSGEVIGEIMKNFTQLKFLSLIIDQTLFAEKGIKSLTAALGSLKKLKYLKIHIIEFTKDTFTRMTKSSVNEFVRKISELPDLEILEHNLSPSEEIAYPQKLSSLSLSYIPYDFVNKQNNKQEIASYETQLKRVYELPYLTRFKFEAYVELKENTPVWVNKKAVDGLLVEKNMILNQLIAVNKHIASYLPFNPQLIAVDLLFN